MLVFVACIKHPDNSQSYADVWRLLNNTLFSVCNQQDKEFRVIVVCDKKLPLFHHEALIGQYTNFIEVDFPSHDEDVLNTFEQLGNLSPLLADATWWLRWDDSDFAEGRPDGYFHIANVFLNMGTKLLVGILAAKEYNPDYVAIFDGDDYVGNDISAYANSHLGENGWLMTHGYKLAGNQVAPIYAANSFCGTGNIINYALITDFIGEKVTQMSTQNELFEHVDSEFLITLANHKKIKLYFEKHGFPLLDFPMRSVLYQVSHAESSEHAMKILRGKPIQRFKQTKRDGKIRHLTAPLINYFNILADNPPKVFCLGFHKTGTTSLEILLQDMGYQVASPYKNWDAALTEKLEKSDLSELQRLTELFDAFQDAPWFLFYKAFDQWYPNSKFILTIRDSHSWWISFLNYFKNEYKPLFKYIYGYDNPVGHEKVFVERFEEHKRKVLEYFKDRPNDLLVVDVSDDAALQKLSTFLEKPTSYSQMPHANAALRLSVVHRKSSQTDRLRKIKKLLKMGRNTFPFIVKKASFKAPIIIGGSKFSGTEIALSILSRHPNVHSIRNIKLNYPRYHHLALAVDRTATTASTNRNGGGPIDLLHLNKMLMRDRISSSAKRWASTNHLIILVYKELLDYYGKDLRILNVVRDGRDVVTEKDVKIMARYAVPCDRWVYDVKEGVKLENHPQVLTIRYEDLVQDTEKTTKKIAEFIGESDIGPFLHHSKGAKIVESHYWVGKWQQAQHAKRVEDLLQTPGALECLQHYGYLK
jgi:Sulfotransferase domain